VKQAASTDQRIARMSWADVYPLYLAKVERKGRSKAELDQVICWFTGLDAAGLQRQLAAKPTFTDFFSGLSLNANASLITGVICGVRVEEIENPLTQKVRRLDKVVDELAKGRKIESILRKG
jgi:hypothetical protein